MSIIQKLFVLFTPRSVAEAAEAESRRWIMRCPRGHERSVWDSGGLRYKASGNPRRHAFCPECGKASTHLVYHRDSPPASLDTMHDSDGSPPESHEGESASPRDGQIGSSGLKVAFQVLTYIGLAFLVASVAFLATDLIFTLRASPVSGKVVRLVVGRGTRPVVAYQVEEVTHEITGRVGTSPPAYEIGEIVPVLYRSSQPERGRIDTFTDRYLLPTIFGSLGVVLLGLSAGGLLWLRLTSDG